MSRATPVVLWRARSSSRERSAHLQRFSAASVSVRWVRAVPVSKVVRSRVGLSSSTPMATAADAQSKFSDTVAPRHGASQSCFSARPTRSCMRQRNPCCRAAVGELLGRTSFQRPLYPFISVSGLLPYPCLTHAAGPTQRPRPTPGPNCIFIMRFPPNTTARAQKSGALPLP